MGNLVAPTSAGLSRLQHNAILRRNCAGGTPKEELSGSNSSINPILDLIVSEATDNALDIIIATVTQMCQARTPTAPRGSIRREYFDASFALPPRHWNGLVDLAYLRQFSTRILVAQRQ